MAAQVEGTVEAVERGFRYRPMLRVAITDDSHATLVLRFFHFRAVQAAQFAPGVRVRCYGTPRAGGHGFEIVHPSYRILDDEVALEQDLDPVYPAVEGVGPASLRRLIGLALDRLPDEAALELLPRQLRESLRLPSLREALLTVHRPQRDADIAALLAGTHPAQRRLVLEELLAHHLSLRRQRIAQQAHAAPALRDTRLANRLRDALPFRLTGAQQRVFEQILVDLAQCLPARPPGDLAGEPRHAHAEGLQPASQVCQVLLGEQFGRRHQRDLPALLDREHSRERGHDGLAAAHVALHQP